LLAQRTGMTTTKRWWAFDPPLGDVFRQLVRLRGDNNLDQAIFPLYEPWRIDGKFRPFMCLVVSPVTVVFPNIDSVGKHTLFLPATCVVAIASAMSSFTTLRLWLHAKR
jgi:hypothetical protein